MTTLPGYRPYTPATRRRRRMGTAALVLGLVAVPLAALCGVGALPVLAGLGLGIVAAAQDRGRRHAVIGIVAALVALSIAALVVVWLLGKAAKCGRYTDEAARRHCVEREFPMVKRKPQY